VTHLSTWSFAILKHPREPQLYFLRCDVQPVLRWLCYIFEPFIHMLQLSRSNNFSF
jgi:hypothetical protein